MVAMASMDLQVGEAGLRVGQLNVHGARQPPHNTEERPNVVHGVPKPNQHGGLGIKVRFDSLRKPRIWQGQLPCSGVNK